MKLVFLEERETLPLVFSTRKFHKELNFETMKLIQVIVRLSRIYE